MPSIIGLNEQKEALKEIQAYLKKINGINDFLKNLDSYSGPFEISFQKEETITIPAETNEADLLPSDDTSSEMDVENLEGVEGAFGSDDEPAFAEEAARTETVKKTYRSSFVVKDVNVIKNEIVQSKNHYVEKITQLCDKYHISLDASDEAIIYMFD